MSYRTILIFLFSITCYQYTYSQVATSNQSEYEVREYEPEVTRILFLLDASGSMKETWNGRSKWSIAKDLLYNLIDSLGSEKQQVEFAVRIFGHQSHRSLMDCEDSKLEITFDESSPESFRNTLESITPQGQTPIAYSLYLASNDFRSEKLSTNAIIMITDGNENCDGDPCAASRILERRRISLKPFIIGLNIDTAFQRNFECVGTYFDTKDEEAFNEVLDLVIAQALNTTTVQVNLIDKFGKTTVTDIPFTLYDHYSKEIRYNFIHTMSNGVSDTLYLDPVGRYDIEIHSIPTIVKQAIELEPGKHNIITLNVPVSNFNISINKEKVRTKNQAIVREAYSPDILYMQDINDGVQYLSGDFDLEILTNPRIIDRLIFMASTEDLDYKIEQAGKVSIVPLENMAASVYSIVDEEQNLLIEYPDLNLVERLELQPGEYMIVYKAHRYNESDFTKSVLFTVESGKVTSLKL